MTISHIASTQYFSSSVFPSCPPIIRPQCLKMACISLCEDLAIWHLDDGDIPCFVHLCDCTAALVAIRRKYIGYLCTQHRHPEVELSISTASDQIWVFYNEHKTNSLSPSSRLKSK